MEISHKQYDSKQCYEVRIGSVYIGFSYKTPVTLHDAGPNGRTLKTDEYYSRTTNHHMQVLLGRAERVSQNELEREIEFALARQALNTLKGRLFNGSASTGSPDQSESGAGIGSSVLRELGIAAQAD